MRSAISRGTQWRYWISPEGEVVERGRVLLDRGDRRDAFDRSWGDEAARELAADVVIVGGGFGGCAAALAACRAGLNVVMTEETDWIGGQVTAQGVPPDEHPWIERFGCTRAYREYRMAVRAHYRQHYPLTAAARADPSLNPGNGRVSRICHEPRVSLAVLQQMLAPYESGRRLRVLTRHVPVAADVSGDRVRAVRPRDLRHDRRRTLVAPWFVDATELGDFLPLTTPLSWRGGDSAPPSAHDLCAALPEERSQHRPMAAALVLAVAPDREIRRV